jgi:hypothetical protein
MSHFPEQCCHSLLSIKNDWENVYLTQV